MLLAIDAGNTNIVIATFGHDDPRPIQIWRLETIHNRPVDEYEAFFQTHALKNITAIVVSSVVPPIDVPLRQACENFFNIVPDFVTYGMPGLGVVVDLPDPHSMGADRLVNTVAVKRDYTCPAIVIDCGTATTFDVLDARGHFVGGVIAPGANLSMKALHLAAAKLPAVPIAKPPAVIGTDTVTAMQSGVYWGYVGLIEGILQGIRAEMSGDVHVIATGGLAGLFAEGTSVINVIDPDLTLRGLYYIHQSRKP